MAVMWTTFILALSYVLAWAVVLRVLTRQRMESSTRIAWIMIVSTLPVVGIIAYLLFGEVRIAHAERQRARDIRDHLSGIWEPSPDAVTDPPDWLAGISSTVRAVGGMMPLSGNRLALLAEADDGFDAMIHAIDAAEDHVHVLFYIWLDDTSGRRVATALCAAARRGVACRVIVDAIGSRKFTRTTAWREMLDSGVELDVAMPAGFSAFHKSPPAPFGTA